MAKQTTNPTRRRPTRYRGITYRERTDGSRHYAVFFQGRYIGVEGGEQDALAKEAHARYLRNCARIRASVLPLDRKDDLLAEELVLLEQRLKDSLE